MITSRKFFRNFLILILPLFLGSCGELTQIETSKSKTNLNSAYYFSGDGVIFSVNPVVAHNSYTIGSADYGNKLVRDFVTHEPYLQRQNHFQRAFSSSSISESTPFKNIFQVQKDDNVTTTPLQSESGSWRADIHSDEFYEVNTFYHVNKVTERFYKAISFGHAYLYLDSNMRIPPSVKYNFESTNSLWLTQDNGDTQTLSVYSKCLLQELNAFFSPSESVLCIGYDTDYPYVFMAQDPSIIYHETGHVIQQAMLNQRNSKYDAFTGLTTHDFSLEMGQLAYDEAGALGEGISDYFSYFVNGRDAIGEWATGRFFDTARPISEANPIHKITGLSETSAERLSYPNYVFYNPNIPTARAEDIHMAGQIVSHYLVALNKSLANQCSTNLNLSTVTNRYFDELVEQVRHDFGLIYGLNSQEAQPSYAKSFAFSSAMIMVMLNETFAELGDLFGEGSDIIADGQFFTNMSNAESFLWATQVNPINFRKFFKVFAKNIKHHISEGLCPAFTLDESEQLLDDYGLLLFSYYGDTGLTSDGATDYVTSINGAVSDLIQGQLLNPVTSTDFNLTINELNRRKTALVSKDYLQVATNPSIYIIDNYNTMVGFLNSLTFQGSPVSKSPENIASVRYNNSNSKISPGEIVAFALNIKNNSNTPISGLQVLGNDWDHMKIVDESAPYIDSQENIQLVSSQIAQFNPCIFENFPLDTEGGITDTDNTDPGNCSYTSRSNLVFNTPVTLGSETLTRYALDAPQPVCLVQYSDENETKWVSQNYFRKVSMSLEDSKCLNNSEVSQDNYNPNECLIRVLPGANQAFYSLLDPQKTWAQTVIDESQSTASFGLNSYMVMEVNKWIEPGTKFRCRFRARFSNCQDCFGPDSSSPDYADYQYTGATPFKVLHMDFTVTD